MEQSIFSGIRPLYSSLKGSPNEMEFRIRMRDFIDPSVLRSAVDTTMKRYPYFCVELLKKNDQYVFIDNARPVTISHAPHGADLNSKEANMHMLSFAWYDNWIVMDIFHGLTDGTGAYEVIRTLLYYYCSERYGVKLDEEGIRLAGDEISSEEWIDPLEKAEDLPTPVRREMPKAINLAEAAGLGDDHGRTVYSITIPESEFMHFNIENDGSPATIVALFLCRAIAKMYPDAEDAIRVALCINQRKAFKAPLAHQSLVGGAMLEYKDKMQSWPLSRQATAFRGMVFVQSQDEAVLAGANNTKGLTQMLLSKKTDEERLGVAAYVGSMASTLLCATVSYVGKANYKGAEKYIRDFRSLTTPSGGTLLIEIAAVNGKFTLDVIQPFSSPIYVEAFLKELEDNSITYDLQEVMKPELPNIRLPWSE